MIWRIKTHVSHNEWVMAFPFSDDWDTANHRRVSAGRRKCRQIHREHPLPVPRWSAFTEVQCLSTLTSTGASHWSRRPVPVEGETLLATSPRAATKSLQDFISPEATRRSGLLLLSASPPLRGWLHYFPLPHSAWYRHTWPEVRRVGRSPMAEGRVAPEFPEGIGESEEADHGR